MIIYFLEIFISLILLISGYYFEKYIIVADRNTKIAVEIVWIVAMLIPIIMSCQTETGKEVWCYLCQFDRY